MKLLGEAKLILPPLFSLRIWPWKKKTSSYSLNTSCSTYTDQVHSFLLCSVSLLGMAQSQPSLVQEKDHLFDLTVHWEYFLGYQLHKELKRHFNWYFSSSGLSNSPSLLCPSSQILDHSTVSGKQPRSLYIRFFLWCIAIFPGKGQKLISEEFQIISLKRKKKLKNTKKNNQATRQTPS